MSDHHVYEAVAARRNNFDSMLWQVPTMSLTAQAFLFTIALDPSSSRFSRIIVSLLGVVIVVLCVSLMARQRQAELVDAQWLADYEIREGVGGDRVAFGEAWSKARNGQSLGTGWVRHLPLWPAFNLWVVGLLLFGAVSVGILGVSIFCPSLIDAR